MLSTTYYIVRECERSCTYTVFQIKEVLTSPISVIKACMEVIKAEKIMKKATTAVSVAAADQSLFFSSS